MQPVKAAPWVRLPRWLRSALRTLRRHAWWRTRACKCAAGLGLTIAGAGIAWNTGLGDAGTAIAIATERELVSAELSVQQVTVSGRYATTPAELRTALGVERGSSILQIDPGAARERIEALDWVAEARVTRLLPQRVHINLVEHRPLAIWQHQGQMALINAAGEIITARNIGAFADLPLIVGEGAAAEAASFLAFLNTEPALAARVKAAVRVGGRRWGLHLKDGIELRLPEENAPVAWRRFVALQQRHQLLSRDISVVDLRLEDRWSVRLKETASQSWRKPGEET